MHLTESQIKYIQQEQRISRAIGDGKGEGWFQHRIRMFIYNVLLSVHNHENK